MRKPVCLKQKLHRVMSQLQTETEKGDVKEGAQVRIAKHLKSAFEAHDKRKDRCIQEYMIDCFVDDPFGAMSVPSRHRHLMEDPNFLRRLIHTKRKRDGAPIEDKWWDDYMEGFLPEWMFFQPDDVVLQCIARTCIIMALGARWHVLEPIERRLNKLGLAPHEIFPIRDVRPPTLFPTDPESEEEFGLDVWHALETEPRFLRWLLKPDANCPWYAQGWIKAAEAQTQGQVCPGPAYSDPFRPVRPASPLPFCCLFVVHCSLFVVCLLFIVCLLFVG